MRRSSLIFACIVLLFSPSALLAQNTGPVQGNCILGGTQAKTSGLSSTNYLQGIIPSCTVTVLLSGTQTKATIYADANNTPLTNPFTANSIVAVNPGGWTFYAALSSLYDVVLTGGIPPNVYLFPVTLKGVGPGETGPFCALSGCTMSGTLTAPQFIGPLSNLATNTLIGNVPGPSYVFSGVNYSLANVQSDFQSQQSGTNNFTGGVTGAIENFNTSTQYQINGVSGFVRSNNGNPSVAVYGQAICAVNGSNCFGANPLVASVSGLSSGATLQGMEVDVNAHNSADFPTGIAVKGAWSVSSASGSSGYLLAKPGSGVWQNGFISGTGASNNAFVAGPMASGNGQSSQPLVFIFTTSGGLSATSTINADSSGDLVLTPFASAIVTGTQTGSSSTDSAGILSNPIINFQSGGTGLWGVESAFRVNVGNGLTSNNAGAVFANGQALTNSGSGTVNNAYGIFATTPAIGATKNVAGFFSGPIQSTGSVEIGSIGALATNTILNMDESITGSASSDTFGALFNPAMTFTSGGTGLWGVSASPKITSASAVAKAASLWANGGGMTLTGGGSITQAYGLYATAPTVGSTNYAGYFSGNVFSTGTVAASSGTNIVYRCSVAGTLRAGQLTTVSADCGTAVDTGLRVP